VKTLHLSARPGLPRRGIAVALSAAALGALGWNYFGAETTPAASPAVATRRLNFADRADGGIDVIDAERGELIEAMHGEQGFLRGSLRALMRARRQRAVAQGGPVELLAHADGRLSLHDPATGERIDLGPSNTAVYARWLPAAPARRTS
jgi:putative photosynthetic complex assembly protein